VTQSVLLTGVQKEVQPPLPGLEICRIYINILQTNQYLRLKWNSKVKRAIFKNVRPILPS